ncbi:MAG TPA: kelch repeat-containing protein [Chitinophagales bacterium]|nr:kelch repeat-containing protein [Chitinophagales bacterium]
MIKNLHLFAAIILFTMVSLPVFSQWTQRQNLPGMPRTFATGFTINSTIYVMGGFDGTSLFNDVWAYDAETDAWTQKANFPGGYRAASTAFTIGSKAYMGTGNDGNIYLKDFWEYNPLTDAWIQKADFPGYEREEAVGFGIGDKGYMGTGQTFVVGPNDSWTTTYNDFYEYDPTTDTWSQKANLPGAPRAYAVGAVVGNKGYLGLGGNDDQSASYTDFYEYDPVADNWMLKTSIEGSGRADAGAVASGNNIYVIGGINFPNFSGFSSCKVYNVLTDTWLNAPVFNPGIIIAPVVQNVGGKVFAGTGYNSAFAARNDWWEFTSLTTSIETAEVDQAFVFSNPFSNELNLSTGNNQGDLRIEILDAQGRLVYSAPQNIHGSETVKINTADFPNGIYLLLVKSSSGAVTISKKIIKN